MQIRSSRRTGIKSKFYLLLKIQKRLEKRINAVIALIPYTPLMGVSLAALVFKLSLELTPLAILLFTFWGLITATVLVKTNKNWDDKVKKAIQRFGIYPIVMFGVFLTLLLEVGLTPAHGQFLNNAQTWMNTSLNQQGNAQIQNAIDLIFNVLRGMFVIYIASEIVKIVNSRDEDGDWKAMAKKPLIVLLALVIGDLLVGLVTG